jgi:3-hydroxyisobutyrate dehydrogenase-like beta-hydroxyacid dehydrogenase
MRLRIGFIGLGTMGEPIANNLRRAGHDVTVWNRTPARADHIVSRGGKRAATPRECASGKDAVFTCVSDERALDAVLDGPDGALAGLREGDVLVDLTTAGLAAARSVAARAAARGARSAWVALIVAAPFAVAVGASRLAVGAHWPADVLVGAGFGVDG